MWIALTVSILALTVIGVVVLLVVRSRVGGGSKGAATSPPADADTFIRVGAVLLASGAALMITVGTSMIGVLAVGVVFIAVGASRRSHG